MRKNRFRSIFEKEEIEMEHKGCISKRKAFSIIFDYLSLAHFTEITYEECTRKFLKEVAPYEERNGRFYYYCSDVTCWLTENF